MNRRSFLLGLLSTTAAPVVAKATIEMAPEVYALDIECRTIRTGLPSIVWRQIHSGVINEMPLTFSGYETIYNGVPVREATELLSQRNEMLRGIFGPYPNFAEEYDDE